MQTATAQEFSISTQAVAREATAYLFYPLNMIAPAIKATVPSWAAGGLLRPELATLRHRNGYIRQCEITECRQHMVGQSMRNVMPAERRHMAQSYVLTENGHSQTISGRSSESDDSPLLFTPWYPDQELGPVLAQNDGLVRMPVRSAAEARAAQYFLFPDWDQYLSGRKALPTKLAQIKEMLIARQATAQPGTLEAAVAGEAIRACDMVEAFGRAHVAVESARYQEAQTKGWAWSYGTDAELYMDQLGIQRRDNLAQEQASKIDRLADVLAEAFSRRPLVEPPVVATEVLEVVEPEPEPVAAKVGSIVRHGEKVGKVVAVRKTDCTVEEPNGETFKAPLAELEVAG